MSDLDSTPLGKLIQIRKGKKPASVSPRKQNEAQRPYLLIDSFGGEYKSFTDDTSCPYAKADETLLVWDGERCGLTSTGHEGYIGSTLASIESATEDLHPNYLFHFLVGKQKEIRNSAEGTGVPHVSRRFLEDLEITLPPLPEQKKIAEILSGIDMEINCLGEQRERWSRVLATISERLIHDHKSKFPARDLIEVCSVITKGATPTTFGHQLSGIRFPGSVTFLGGGSTSDSGEFDQTPARYCSPEAVSTLNRSALREGDTLITIVGASIGNTCQIPASALPANINQNVALVRGDESVIDSSYLSLYLKSEGRKALVNIATTQAQPSVSLKQVGELQIPIPSLEEQRRASEAIASIQSFTAHLDLKMQAISLLKQALSSDLLSGRKRVSF